MSPAEREIALWDVGIIAMGVIVALTVVGALLGSVLAIATCN